MQFLLDTNHLSVAVTPGSHLRERIVWMQKMGARVGTCVPALCELERGIPGVRDPQYYRRILSRFLEKIQIWPLDLTTARLYGDVFQQLQRCGCVCSQVDMMLAALARQCGMTLLTSDKDFDALPDLSVENWL